MNSSDKRLLLNLRTSSLGNFVSPKAIEMANTEVIKVIDLKMDHTAPGLYHI